MLLAIDIGNTNMVIGIFQLPSNNRPQSGREGEAQSRGLGIEGATRAPLIEHWRLETKKERTSDEFGILIRELFQFAKLNFENIKAVVISSVVPTLDFAMERMCERYLKIKPLWITPQVKTPIKIKLDNPKEIGADRIVNAVAGFKKYGGPLIIVDFGTATTFDYINSKAEYRGGMIAPGISISNEALFERAAKLPHVEIKKPLRAIGRNTIESMQAGIYFGYIGMVDEIIKRMIAESKEKKVQVIATGGFTSLIVPESKRIKKVDPFLTLEGMRLIWERNR